MSCVFHVDGVEHEKPIYVTFWLGSHTYAFFFHSPKCCRRMYSFSCSSFKILKKNDAINDWIFDTSQSRSLTEKSLNVILMTHVQEELLNTSSLIVLGFLFKNKRKYQRSLISNSYWHSIITIFAVQGINHTIVDFRCSRNIFHS